MAPCTCFDKSLSDDIILQHWLASNRYKYTEDES